jgi:hypothetical protein
MVSFGRITTSLALILGWLALAGCGGKDAGPATAPTPAASAVTPAPAVTAASSPVPLASRWLAYLRAPGATSGYVLRVVKADGSGDTQVADNVLGFRWSYDGGSIAYWTTDGQVYLTPIAASGAVGQPRLVGAGDSAVFGPAGDLLAFRQVAQGGQGASRILVVSTKTPGQPSVLVDQGPVIPAPAGGKEVPAGPWDWYPLAWNGDGKLFVTGTPLATRGATGNIPYIFFIAGSGSLMPLPASNLAGRAPVGAAIAEMGPTVAFAGTFALGACEFEGALNVVSLGAPARAVSVADLLSKPSPGAHVVERPYGVAFLDPQTLLYSAGGFDTNLCSQPSPRGANAAGAISGPFIYRVSLDGSVRNLALEDAAWPSVSPDKRYLAFTRGAAGQDPRIVVTDTAAMMSSAIGVIEGEQAQWRR